jgi:hypothetical protein
MRLKQRQTDQPRLINAQPHNYNATSLFNYQAYHHAYTLKYATRSNVTISTDGLRTHTTSTTWLVWFPEPEPSLSLTFLSLRSRSQNCLKQVGTFQ